MNEGLYNLSLPIKAESFRLCSLATKLLLNPKKESQTTGVLEHSLGEPLLSLTVFLTCTILSLVNSFLATL